MTARIAIAGGPRTGKTSLALALSSVLNIPVRHTDELVGKLEWSDASAEVATWLDAPGPWVIEGVAVTRALRKWRARWRDAHPGEPDPAPPVDRIVYLTEPHEPLSKGQASMAKGAATVHAEIAAWLAAHGVLGTLEQSATPQAAAAAAALQPATAVGGAFVDVIFSGPPNPESDCEFVEVENDQGASISLGEWVQRPDGYWALRIRSADARRHLNLNLGAAS